MPTKLIKMDNLKKGQKFAYRGAHNSSINKVLANIPENENHRNTLSYINSAGKIELNNKMDGVKVILIT